MQPLVCHHRVGRCRRRRRHPLRPMIAAGEMVLRAALAGLVTDADRGQCEAKTELDIASTGGNRTIMAYACVAQFFNRILAA